MIIHFHKVIIHDVIIVQLLISCLLLSNNIISLQLIFEIQSFDFNQLCKQYIDYLKTEHHQNI